MSLYQVVEKDVGSDWQPVRYYDKALTRFETQEDAIQAALDYLTDRNCNNALTADEKLAAAEVFMMTDEGALLGMLDGKKWFLQYPKNGPIKNGAVSYSKGDNVKDPNYFALEGKAQVAVRTLPGS